MLIFNSHKTIEVLQHFLPANPVIVEVGAFNGSDTKKMVAQWPAASVHCFEPLPEIYSKLEANTMHLPQVHRYPVALSDSIGVTQFYVAEKPNKPGVASQAGSLLKPKDRLLHSAIIFPRMAQVATTTLDSWAQEYHIEAIDLLWLDTQGHERTILQAAPIMIKRTAVVLAEVSFIESYEGQPLYGDLVTWMEEQGFEQIGQDFQDTNKSFFGNVLFVRR
jgi:2-O-methyltransferase